MENSARQPSLKLDQPEKPYAPILIRLYALMLRLYPGAFQAKFAGEMCDVFAMSLRNAHGTAALCAVIAREVACLPIAVWQVRQQAFAQLPKAVQRQHHIRIIVRLAGAVLAGFLLMTLNAIFSPSYHLYAAAVPFAVALLAATISLLLGVFWGRLGGILTLCTGAVMGCCMTLYVYLMGVEKLGIVATVFIGILWALPFLIFGILFYELSKPQLHTTSPA